MSDQTLAFEFPQGNRHTGSPHTEHDSEELMRKRQFVAVDSVMR